MLFFITLLFSAKGQEIHFSQIANNPLFCNPASTGLFDGDFRIGATYRSQGRSISVPYTTYSGWGDTHLALSQSRNTGLGLGILVYSDNAGEGSLKTASGYFSASLVKGFNRENTFRAALGFSLGFINKSVDFTKLVFDRQWDGTIFDPNLQNGEPYNGNSIIEPDFAVGGIICRDFDKQVKATLGASLFHINKPKISFYESENKMEYRLVLHALLNLKVNEQIQLAPGAYFAIQQFSNELMLGSNILFVNDNMKFITGLWYRHERDIIPHLGFFVQDFTVEFSYDINISKLHIASNYRGGLEISLLKTISVKNKTPGCNGF
ncbi:MAG: PorP/SprF family type IX secretion system membrane protein [Bacteroidales bacterium]|nr:PorP/SprF family type IX secretion system membrane protein [Bacteroidales bacterium]